MKKLTLILLLICALAAPPIFAHGFAMALRSGTSDPGTCQPTGLNVFINRNSTPVLKICTAANTWTSLLTTAGGTLTAPLLLPNGSATAPSWAWSSDADGTGTGAYRGAANSIWFAINGSDAWAINASKALVCGTDGGCDIGNGAADPRDISVQRSLILRGSTSGTLTLKAAAVAGANTLTLPAGTTDLSATGGTDFVLKQESAGAAITVAQLAHADLSTYASGTVAYNAGNFTASGGTWTVDEADQAVFTYVRNGNLLTIAFQFNTTDVSATPTSLIFAIPNSYVAATAGTDIYTRNNAAAGWGYGAAEWAAAGTTITLSPTLGTSWTTTAADNTSVRGTIQIRIQ